MATLKQLCTHLDELYQSNLFVDYGPNGLQIEGSGRILKTATAVSASLDTIKSAAKHGVQALIVHHGLFWNKDPYVIVGAKKEKIEILVKHGISLLAYHLPMDAHQEIGNNWKAARDLGWEDLKPFYKLNGMPIGVLGTVKKQNRNAFKQKLEKYYGHKAEAALGGKTNISTAALISGGAYKAVQDAALLGVDCFITGNFDEPVWNLAHEEKINFFALGHSATERIGPKALGDHLEKQLGVENRFLKDDNPF